MRAFSVEDQVHIPAATVVGALLTAAAGLFVWIFKAAAGQMLREITHSIDRLTASVDEHRKELADMRVEMAEFSARLKALEKADE